MDLLRHLCFCTPGSVRFPGVSNASHFSTQFPQACWIVAWIVVSNVALSRCMLKLSHRMLNCFLGSLVTYVSSYILNCYVACWIVPLLIEGVTPDSGSSLCTVNCHLACCITNLKVWIVITNFVKWNVAFPTRMFNRKHECWIAN